MDAEYLGLALIDWLELAGITAAMTIVLMGIRRLFFGRISAMAAKTQNKVDDVVAELLHGLRTFFLFVVSFYVAVEFIATDTPAIPSLLRVVFIGMFIQLGLSSSDLIRLSSE